MSRVNITHRNHGGMKQFPTILLKKWDRSNDRFLSKDPLSKTFKLMEVLMSIKPSEFFHETLLLQYKDMIKEAWLECETDHRTHLNLEAIEQKFHVIITSAKNDGISPSEIDGLIEEYQCHLNDYQKVA